MKITAIKYYNGSLDKVSRLGLSGLFLELQSTILNTNVTLLEERDANGAAEIRKALDESLEGQGGWEKIVSGGIDWIKKVRYNSSILARIGVEIQVSARSDLIVRDIIHIRNSLQNGLIDVAVIVVPSNLLETYLPDRSPALRDAVRYIEVEFPEAQNFPIILVAIEHDGPGDRIVKQKRKG